MLVLGVSGRRSEAAAAVASDDGLVAAAVEADLRGVPDIGYRVVGGLPVEAARACLDKLRVEASDVEQVAIVDDERWTVDRRLQVGSDLGQAADACRSSTLRVGLSRCAVYRVSAARAAAELAGLVAPERAAIVVVDADRDRGIAVFRSRADHPSWVGAVPGGHDLTRAQRLIAEALGVAPVATETLFELAVQGEPRWLNAMQRALGWKDEVGVRLDLAGLYEVVREAQGDAPEQLADGEPLHRDVQKRRHDLAASFTRVLTDVVVELTRSVAPEGLAAFGGSLFASPRLNADLRASLGPQMSVSPVPERAGLALGAALSCATRTTKPSLQGLDLGPAFTEEQVKQTLDNCRVDYVYEPDWQRLLSRVSGFLARGKVVAWFQGAAEFGRRPQGCRSVLGDPSNRYIRHNINEYLFQRSLDASLALVVREEDAATCFPEPIQSPFTLLRMSVKADLRSQLQAVVDGRTSATVQTLNRQQAPELHDLLLIHLRRTDVPGLVHCPLLTPGGALAVTPRSAMQTVFSSAIDALVIGRFLLMKDYWLLRSAGD